MHEFLIPPFIFFFGALLTPVFPAGWLRGIWTLIVPIAAVAILFHLGDGSYLNVNFYGLELELCRVDALSRIFVIVFCLAALLGNIYAWHLRDTTQQVAALLYAGSAVGATLAGDLITLFFYWEGTAIASVFLIWARGTEGAYWTGLRYLIAQVGSGVVLIAGIVLYYFQTGSIAFDQMELGSLATWMILFAFGIKAAFPFLHNWMIDAYPSATVTGAVILSAFTTKLAIYALARTFAGEELLIYIGIVMVVFTVIYAQIENDLRRVLAYSLNNQLGFMVIGVGVGTELALNGVAGHAFVHILYKSLLFMAVGAVLFRTGTAKATELGGLYRTMPLTMIFCIIGAMSASAFPLFSAFATKSLILDGVAKEGLQLTWVVLVFGSIGVLAHAGIKIPYEAFFSKDSGKRPKEAPSHMLIAMGIAAAFCLGIGFAPSLLYRALPFEMEYVAYTTSHVVGQVQLLLFGGLGFVILVLSGIAPVALKAVNLDFDWVTRKALPYLFGYVASAVRTVWGGITDFLNRAAEGAFFRMMHTHGPEGRMARQWPTGAMVLSIAILLALSLLINFV
ncbi:MAG: Na(+)/H(+) antiporter subunit D [Pseudomonadota bacterium]